LQKKFENKEILCILEVAKKPKGQKVLAKFVGKDNAIMEHNYPIHLLKSGF